MAASEVAICNVALQKLGETRITALTQDHPVARDCNACYEAMRELELRKHRWRFAIERASLAADSTEPAFGYDNRFLLPSDCLRVIEPDPDQNDNKDWQIEGRYILTDWEAPLEIRYIKNVTDVSQHDALFDEVLACRIAIQLCEVRTQSQSKKEDVKQQYRDALSEARRVNAMESIPQEAETDDWLTARI